MKRPVSKFLRNLKMAILVLMGIILCSGKSAAVNAEPQEREVPADISTFSERVQDWLHQEPSETRLLVKGNAALEGAILVQPQSYGDLSLYIFDSEQEAVRAYEDVSDIKGVVAELDFVYELIDLNDSEGMVSENQLIGDLKNLNQGDHPVTIAIIDTGASQSHPLLAGRLKNQINVITTDSSEQDIADENGHGTKVAALIAKNTPENVKLLPIKAAAADGRSTASAVYLGIWQAVQAKADMIHISMNSLAGRNSKLVNEAVKNAVDSGIPVIISAGNHGGDVSYYSPANLSEPIVVGSVDSKKTRSYFSNIGSTIDFVSDGEHLAMQDMDGNSKLNSGTSYAAALVTAAAARVKSEQPGISVTDLEQEMIKQAQDLGSPGWDEQYGHGYLSATDNVETGDGDEPDTDIKAEVQTLISVSNWRDLDESALQELYANSSMEQISTFLQTNAADKELIRNRIPALTKEIKVKDGTREAYTFFEKLDTGGYSISAGRDLGNSFTGFFWFYLSCDGYFRPAKEVPSENHVESWYKIHIYNVSYQGTGNSSTSGSSSQRKYQVAVEKIYQNGKPSTDYFDFYLRYNQSGSMDYGTRLESSSAESDSGTTSYSIYRIYASFIQREYHRADFGLVSWYSGKRLNTREYNISNSSSQPNTLDESVYPSNDTRTNFVIQVHNGNTGQASRFNSTTGKWEDDKVVHAVARLRMFPTVINAGSTDVINGGDFHGKRIGSSGSPVSHTYPVTSARGSEWGTVTPIQGYHFTSDSSQDYYGGPHKNLEVFRYFSPNTYQIRYEGGVSVTGLPYSSSHRYDTWGNLSANQFSYPLQVSYQITEGGSLISGIPDRYTLMRQFLSWQYLGVSYQQGQAVRNLTSGKDDIITMQALWGAANGSTLPASSVNRRGYTLKGWKSKTDKFLRPGQEFQTENSLVFQSEWIPGIFRITLDNQGGEENTRYTRQIYQKYSLGYYRNAEASTEFADQKIAIPEKSIPDDSLPEGKRRMKFKGYYTMPEGLGFRVVDSNGVLKKSIDGADAYEYFTADSTVYALWKEQKKITFDSNLTEKDINLIGDSGYQVPEQIWEESGTSLVLKYQPAVVTNQKISEMYRFLGWSLTPEIQNSSELILSADKLEYSFNISKDLILYGQWDSSYKLAFIGNEQTEGNDYLNDVDYFRDEYQFPGNEDLYFKKTEYRPTIDIQTGKKTDLNGNPVMELVEYSFQGWSMFYDLERQLEYKIIKKENPVMNSLTLVNYAKMAESYESGLGITWGTPGKRFREESKMNKNPHSESVDFKMPFFNLFAVWDSYPQINASNLYLPLSMAQKGDITESLLLEFAEATDQEQIIHGKNPKGLLQNGEDPKAGTSFRVVDYSESDFKNAKSEITFTITYLAKDNAGNSSEKIVTVYLIDTNVNVKQSTEIRFISKNYIDTLTNNSIWRTEEYNRVLAEVLGNKKGNQQYTVVNDSLNVVGVRPKLIPGSGEWGYSEQIWVFSKEDCRNARNFVDKYGLGNKTDLFFEKFLANQVQ